VNVRRFEPSDASRVCEIYYRSVREVGPAKYTQAQLEAWAPKVPDFEKWRTRCLEYETFVADNDVGEPVGWIAMTADGYIDMLFCLPEATRCGVGSALYAAIERVAVDRGLTELTAHASAFAESFFKKIGWFVRERETVGTGDAAIVRALMAKTPLQGDP
jgi:GNAT superfamily N-acetyltransferase